MLEAFGARVEAAEDAQTALEATRRLRASGLNGGTPVIAVTGAVSVQDRLACHGASMTGMIEKPVAPADPHAALFGAAEDQPAGS